MGKFMNRRNFIKNLMVAGAAFTVLPGAGRIWKAERAPVILSDDLPHIQITYRWNSRSGADGLSVKQVLVNGEVVTSESDFIWHSPDGKKSIDVSAGSNLCRMWNLSEYKDFV